MNFQIPIVLLACHFVADFILQSDWMAQNKSKDWGALALHVVIYSACFLWCPHPAVFFAVTFGTHFCTDAITSRINSRLWQAKRVHWFFVGVGGDQLIHAATLALTWSYLR